MQVAATGQPGDILQQSLVRACLAVAGSLTYAQGMDADAFAGGKAGCSAWWHDAAIIGAVGQQNQVFLAGVQITQTFDAKTNGVANCGIVAGNARFDPLQPVTQAVVVKRQWCLQVSLAGKKNQAKTVIRSAGQQLQQQLPSGIESADVAVLQIFHQHRGRQVYCQHAVATCDVEVLLRFQPLWAGGGKDQ